MEITLGILCDELSYLGYNIKKYPMISENINEFRYYLNENFEFEDEHNLYVINMSFIETNLDNIYPKNIILVGGCPTDLDFDQLNCIIEAPLGISEVTVLQHLSSTIENFHVWEKTLMKFSIEHKSLQTFLNFASQKLTNPIALFDKEINIITTSGNIVNHVDKTIWERIYSEDLSLDEFHTTDEQLSLAKAAQEKQKAFIYHPQKDKDHTYLASSIWIKEVFFGYLGMMDIYNPITIGQQDTVKLINKHLELYLLNNEIFIRISENKKNYFVELLHGNAVPIEMVKYQLRKIGWKLIDNFRLLAIKSQSNNYENNTLFFLIKKINKILNKSIITIDNNKIIILVRTSDYDFSKDKELECLKAFLTEQKLRCGISTAFNDFMKLNIYIKQSNFALDCTDYRKGRVLCFYKDCQRDHIFRILSNHNDLRCYCDPTITTLWDSGNDNKRELVRNLGAYLINGRNTMATARALHVHRNTLMYRLNTISDLLGIDVDAIDNEEIFYYLFSCITTEYF